MMSGRIIESVARHSKLRRNILLPCDACVSCIANHVTHSAAIQALQMRSRNVSQ